MAGRPVDQSMESVQIKYGRRQGELQGLKKISKGPWDSV